MIADTTARPSKPTDEPENQPEMRAAQAKLTLDDLLQMSRSELAKVMNAGHPINPDELAGYEYKGVGHGLPAFVEEKLLWKTFKKTFYADPKRGVLRGWNMRIEQTGIEGDYLPMLRNGRPITFGHYIVHPAIENGRPRRMPRPWHGGLFLDYGRAGNTLTDPALPMRAPLVAVNAGSADLLLGWDYVQLGRLQLPTPAYWSLTRDCELKEVVLPPKG